MGFSVFLIVSWYSVTFLISVSCTQTKLLQLQTAGGEEGECIFSLEDAYCGRAPGIVVL